MKPIEIKDLIGGLLLLIFAVMALDQYRYLEQFASIEAAKTLNPKPSPAFFRTTP